MIERRKLISLKISFYFGVIQGAVLNYGGEKMKQDGLSFFVTSFIYLYRFIICITVIVFRFSGLLLESLLNRMK